MLKGFRKLFVADTLFLPIYCHGIVKVFLPIDENHEIAKRCLYIPLRILIALILFLLLMFTLIILATYHELVHWRLKLKYGNQYYMLIDGSAAVFTQIKRPIVTGVFVYEHDVDGKKSPQQLYDYLVECQERMVQSHPILSSVVCNEMGYYFYKRIIFDLKTVVRPLHGYTTGEEFNQLLDRIGNDLLPFDDTFLWDMQVGQTPIKWPDFRQDRLQIPVLIRYNHMLGDGVTILTLVTSYMMKNGLKAVEARCNEYKRVLDNSTSVKKSFMAMLLEMAKKKCVLRSIFDPERTHGLHERNTSLNKTFIYGLDTEDGYYLQTIKNIKNKIPNVTFNDVLYTIISASLDEHLRLQSQREKIVLPESVLFAMPYFLHSSDFREFVNTDDPKNPVVTMTNKFSAAFVRIPMCDDEVTGDLYKRLMKIQCENELVKNSLDLPLLLWQSKVLFTLAPIALLSVLSDYTDATVLLSNLTGHGGLETENGFRETDLLTWTTNYKRTGLSMVVFSYNNRLRISLLQDTTFIRTRAEGQKIMDNIFNNICKLNEICYAN